MILLKRWCKKWKSILVDFLSFIGIFWLFVEIASYSTNGGADLYLKNITIFLIAFLLLLFSAIIKNKPKTVFGAHLRGKDNYLEIRIGDAFENVGALVIPVNNEFDMSLGGNVSKANSIQNQLIQKFYAGKTEHLETDIHSKISKGTKCDIGKTIEVEQKNEACGNKKFYLVANSIKRENNRVISEIDHFIQALNGLWNYIGLQSGRDVAVSIPLMNTQHGRDSYLSRMTAIKEIITSYVEASKSLNICEKLIISIHPNDLKKGNIDLDEIEEFLNYSCKHYRQVILSGKKEGEEDTASKVIKIEN